MGKLYSLDLRERIIGYVKDGHGARCRAAAELDDVSDAEVRLRLLAYEIGTFIELLNSLTALFWSEVELRHDHGFGRPASRQSNFLILPTILV